MKAGTSVLGHETDMPTALRNFRFQGSSGKYMLALSFFGFDPTRTWAVQLVRSHSLLNRES
jgi:hypothetical protein